MLLVGIESSVSVLFMVQAMLHVVSAPGVGQLLRQIRE